MNNKLKGLFSAFVGLLLFTPLFGMEEQDFIQHEFVFAVPLILFWS